MNPGVRSVRIGELEVTLLDSVSFLGPEQDGAVVVTGSHGGLSSGRYALRHPPRLVVFNDAGIGKDRAGVAALAMLEGFRIAAATVAADSARIGDAEDSLAGGVISAVNAAARTMGVREGAALREALAALVP